MPEHAKLDRPAFIFTDEPENVSVKHLEQDIFERPEAYRTVLVLGAIATDSEDELPVEGDVIKRVDDYFKFGFDREVDFDPATEAALEGNVEHQELIRSMQSSQNKEKAGQLRDDIRQQRLGFFIDRVIEWKGQNQAKTGLRRTG